ncbi:hypothetical protein ACQP1K_07915 [Sphaerimonospora sp. CA-214678]|uniref:hypothetical protein n=1 Tax=Sphaerimonospora sp. CA-214678 TaxID=3240029 RepID=UPI003D90CDC1
MIERFLISPSEGVTMALSVGRGSAAHADEADNERATTPTAVRPVGADRIRKSVWRTIDCELRSYQAE